MNLKIQSLPCDTYSWKKNPFYKQSKFALGADKSVICVNVIMSKLGKNSLEGGEV